MKKVKLDPAYHSVCVWPDGTKVDAIQISKVLKKHLRIKDRFNLAKVTTAAMCVFDDLAGDNAGGDKLPKEKRWKFKFISKR